MELDSKDEQIKRLRRFAKAAEPLPDNDPFWDIFDDEQSAEDAAMMNAQIARKALAEMGIPLDDPEDDPHD